MSEDRKICRLTQLSGMPIITRETGRKLGNVKDIIFDPFAGKLDSITYEHPGFFNSERRFILLEDIKSIGEDAIMVATGKVIKGPQSARREDLIVNDGMELMGKNVVTEDGDILGSISDVIIDSDTGKTEKYEVSGGAFKDVQEGRRTFPVPEALVVGSDAIVVPSSVKHEMEEQPAGGLQAAYQESRTGASGFWGDVTNWWDRTRRSTRQREAEYVVGKRAGNTVRDDENHVIVWQDDIITENDVQRAREADKLQALTGSVMAGGASSVGERLMARGKEAVSGITGRAEGARSDYEKNRLTSSQREMALGKVSATDINDRNGNIVIEEGEIFTPMILDHLEEEGLLEQVRLKPVMGPERSVAGEVVEVPRIELLVRAEDMHEHEQRRNVS